MAITLKSPQDLEGMRVAGKLAAEVLAMPEQAMRVGGLVAVAIGVLIAWFVRG